MHCGIAGSVVVFELGDAAGAGFDQGDRNSSALLVEELGHTQLLPEDADGHGWGGSASVDTHQAENRMGSVLIDWTQTWFEAELPQEWIRMG